MIDLDFSPCRCCLESQFTNYIKILDMDKLIKARAKALTNNETVICSIEMPMILGAKGHVNYVFKPQEGGKDE